MTWYFNDIPIAKITRDPDHSCTDVRCKNGDERFRGRLMVSHHTGSLTIKDIRFTDSGEYKLQINSSGSSSLMSFNVIVT
ncbi:hypothetical protein M9458_055267, partial [Cirrhinus mrigala]